MRWWLGWDLYELEGGEQKAEEVDKAVLWNDCFTLDVLDCYVDDICAVPLPSGPHTSLRCQTATYVGALCGLRW